MPAETTRPESMLEYALTYAGSGYSVFPVCSPAGGDVCFEGHPGGQCKGKNVGKTPLVRWASAQKCVADEDLIRTWWRRWPRANIGLATGKLSGVCVIDLDGAEALAEAQRLGFEPGPLVTTGRIGGRHAYCAWRDDAPTVFASAGGVDFRGEGGYVVLPPSRHRTGTVYQWVVSPYDAPLPPLPHWVDEMARRDSHGAERGHLDIGQLFANGIDNGERDMTLFRVAAKLRAVDVPEDVALLVLLELAARCRPQFDPDEASRKIESAYKRYHPNTPEYIGEPAEPPGPRELELRRLREKPLTETIQL